MYSVVLMVALTGSADAPTFGHHKRGGCCGDYAGCTGAVAGCTGCAGCDGGCHGRRHHRRHRGRRHGCNGGCSGYVGCAGGYAGCTGYVGCTGGYVGCTGGMPPVQEMPPADKGTGKEKISADAPATVVVNLPADAKLTIDGQLTKATSTKRVFATPALRMGQDFYYTFKATVVRDGRPVTAEKRVRVRAGEQTPVAFDFTATEMVKK